MLNGDVCQTAPSRPREGAFLFGWGFVSGDRRLVYRFGKVASVAWVGSRRSRPKR